MSDSSTKTVVVTWILYSIPVELFFKVEVVQFSQANYRASTDTIRLCRHFHVVSSLNHEAPATVRKVRPVPACVIKYTSDTLYEP